MSRSYRHTLVAKCEGPAYRKFAKKQANKKVRKTKEIYNYKSYRKLYESWDIVDYVSKEFGGEKEWRKFFESKMKDCNSYWLYEDFKSAEEFVNHMKKFYERK